MINWTAHKYPDHDQVSLSDNGYEIENAKITNANLSMADHGVLTLSLALQGAGWVCVYGGYVLGKGYVGAEEFEGSAMGMESIMRIMDIVGVESFSDMKDKYIRVAVKGWGDSVKIIGNIMSDKWFDIDSFFKDKKETEGDLN